MTTCNYCDKPLTPKGKGRVPSFCSSACKQANYRLRCNDFQRERISSAVRRISEEQRQRYLQTLRNTPAARGIGSNRIGR